MLWAAGWEQDVEIHAPETTTTANVTAGSWKLHKWKWPFYTLLLSRRPIHLEKAQVGGDLWPGGKLHRLGFLFSCVPVRRVTRALATPPAKHLHAPHAAILTAWPTLMSRSYILSLFLLLFGHSTLEKAICLGRGGMRFLFLLLFLGVVMFVEVPVVVSCGSWACCL